MLSLYWQVNIISGTRMEKTREGNRFMHIYDLTGGKYGLIAETISYSAESKILDQMERTSFPNKNFLFNRFHTDWWKENTKKILNETPVFLVDTLMCKRAVAVPNTSLYITVPEDTYVETIMDDVDWEQQESCRRYDRESPIDAEPLKSFNIKDFLGVYICDLSEGILPTKIFVWMDKIQSNTTKHEEFEALVENVVIHEIGHSIMDVSNYKAPHNHIFTYSNKIYEYIEEAFANAFALDVQYDTLKSGLQTFIYNFVKKQPKEYATGWEIYQKGLLMMGEWMSTKILAGSDFLDIFRLQEWWKTKDFQEFHSVWHSSIYDLYYVQSSKMGQIAPNLTLIESIHNSRIAFIDPIGKWGVLDQYGERLVTTKYDSIWSFGDNGLCIVRIDKPEGDRYGMINLKGEEQIPVEYDHIYGFENGVTIAKKDGRYGIIDENNNIVHSFNMTYTDVRGFRNGFAPAEKNGKWGSIDTSGKEVVQCIYDSPFYSYDGETAEVIENGVKKIISLPTIIMKGPQYKTTANGITKTHPFTYLPAVTSMLDTLQHHDLTMENIYQISLWKVDRYPQMDLQTLNALNSVKDDIVLDETKTRDILEKLLNTQGVGLPMASAYLRFINPQVYQIIDHRAYRAAFDYAEDHNLPPLMSTLKDPIGTYFGYLKQLQGIAANGYHGISVAFEDLDRFLYDVDKKAGYTVNMPLKDINRDLWEDVVKNLGGKFTRYLLSKADLANFAKNHQGSKK